MKTLTTTALALLLAAGAAGPTFAETATNTPPTNNGQTTPSEPGMTLRQQVQNDLAKAGFTDIRVMPEFIPRPRQGSQGERRDDVDQSGYLDRGDDDVAQQQGTRDQQALCQRENDGRHYRVNHTTRWPDTSTSEKMTGAATSTAPAKQ